MFSSFRIRVTVIVRLSIQLILAASVKPEFCSSGVWVMLQESKPAEKGGKAGNSKKETTAAESAQSGT